MVRRLGFSVVVAVLVLLLGASAHAAKPRLQLTLSSSEISLGEVVVVTVSIDMPGLVGPDRYWPPAVADFHRRDEQRRESTESQIDAKRGQTLTTTVVYQYLLEPRTTGRLRIGPARIRVRGEDYETRERYVRVRRAKGPAAVTPTLGTADAQALAAPGYRPPSGPQPDTFLYAVASATEVWVGQQFTVSWLLFTRGEVLRYEPTPPRLASLWSETLFEPKAYFKYSEARLAGKDYVVALVSKRAFFATEAGVQVVEPLKAKVATVATAMGRGLALASNSLEVTVTKLPEPAPQGFDPSYVGEFKVGATIDRSRVPAGESLTLTLRLDAVGAISRIQPPRLAFPGFRFEAPSAGEMESTTHLDVVSGRRSYRYWTTPENGGAQEIPAIRLSYFSPSEGRYKTASTRPIAFDAEGNGSTEDAAPSALAAMRELHPHSELASRSRNDFYRTRAFWMVLAAPPFIFCAFAVLGRVRSYRQRDTAKGRRVRAQRAAREHLSAAALHRKNARVGAFYGSLRAAVHSHLAVWFGRKTRTMRRTELGVLLKEGGLAEDELGRFEELLDGLERAQFARADVEAESMERAVQSTERMLAAVEANVAPLRERAAS